MTHRRLLGLCLLGVSLSVKHDLIFLPLWLAMLPNTKGGGASAIVVGASSQEGNRRTSWQHSDVGAAHPPTTRGWRWRFLCLTIPYGIFGLTFLPFILAGDGPAIWRKVVMFPGFNNAPLWNTIAIGHVLDVIPPFVLFVATMLIVGWIATRR